MRPSAQIPTLLNVILLKMRNDVSEPIELPAYCGDLNLNASELIGKHSKQVEEFSNTGTVLSRTNYV